MRKLIVLALLLLTGCELGSYSLEWQTKEEAKQIAAIGTLDVVGQIVPEDDKCVLVLRDPNSPKTWTVFFSSEGRNVCATVQVKDKVKLRFIDAPIRFRGYRTEIGDWLTIQTLATSPSDN